MANDLPIEEQISGIIMPDPPSSNTRAALPLSSTDTKSGTSSDISSIVETADQTQPNAKILKRNFIASQLGAVALSSISIEDPGITNTSQGARSRKSEEEDKSSGHKYALARHNHKDDDECHDGMDQYSHAKTSKESERDD